MIMIRNINDAFGDPVTFSGQTLDDAVAEFQEHVTELGYGVVTDSDYEVASE